MIFSETSIHGCFVIGCEPVKDERGIFYRTFDRQEFERMGRTKTFIQHNVSINHKKGTVRGMHYQVPPHAEAKLIQCIAGKVFDVILDLRKNSATFLKWISVELSAEACNQVWIPEGCAHGFQTLEDHSTLLYCHTAAYNKDAEAGIRTDDPQIRVSFPLPVSAISMRDQNHPLLASTFNGLEI